MTDEQYNASLWLSRMDELAAEIESLEVRKDAIIAALGGVARYDADSFTGSSGNPTETKNIEYALLSEKIEKKMLTLSAENARTLDVIDRIDDTPDGRKFKSILINKHLNLYSWKKMQEEHHYERTAMYDWYKKALAAVAPFVPKECVICGG